jgi:hypothetical protein
MEFLEGENSPNTIYRQHHLEHNQEYPLQSQMHNGFVRQAKDLSSVRQLSFFHSDETYHEW